MNHEGSPFFEANLLVRSLFGKRKKKKLKNFDKTSINDSRVTYLLFLCQLTKGETMTITASAKDFKRKILEVMDAI